MSKPTVTIEASGNFGIWLLETLTNNELTVRIVADRTGVSPKDVRNWIKGRAMPKTAYFIFLIRALSILLEIPEEELYLSASEEILKDS